MPKNNEFLSRVMQFDGGFGSLAVAMELPAGCTERLNLTHPESVTEIHRAYVEAGADVIETNTLGANAIRLDAHGLAGESARITEAAVVCARASGARYVACSMGTTAQLLSPVGTLSFRDAADCFAIQARAAHGAGADFLFTETLTDIQEARAMWLAAREVGLPFAASFTFLENGFTLTGSPPEACALAAEALCATMIGVNCVGDMDLLLSLLKRMRAVTRLPVIVQPNAGFPEIIEGRPRYTVTPEMLLPAMEQALSLGAHAIGGCCGTTPEHIRLMAALVKNQPVPPAGGDAIRRVCSLRKVMPLAEAMEAAETVQAGDLDALLDADGPALLDIRGTSPMDAAEFVTQAQSMFHHPLIFRADSEEVLAAALCAYAGVAAVDAPFAPGFGACSI